MVESWRLAILIAFLAASVAAVLPSVGTRIVSQR
jgi:hypothetical protein